METDGVRQQLIQLEAAARDDRRSIEKLGERIGTGEVQDAVVKRDLSEMRHDILELTDSVRWLTRGAWAVAGTFLLLAVMIAVAVVNSGP